MFDQTLARLTTGVGLWLLFVALLAVLFHSINYRLTDRYLLITLVGIPIRWIRIRNIHQMNTSVVFWAERWYNTLSPVGRRLVIRHRGAWFFKTLIITPKSPHGLMLEIQKAKERLKALEATGRE